jgi:hypothetical protein
MLPFPLGRPEGMERVDLVRAWHLVYGSFTWGNRAHVDLHTIAPFTDLLHEKCLQDQISYATRVNSTWKKSSRKASDLAALTGTAWFPSCIRVCPEETILLGIPSYHAKHHDEGEGTQDCQDDKEQRQVPEALRMVTPYMPRAARAASASPVPHLLSAFTSMCELNRLSRIICACRSVPRGLAQKHSSGQQRFSISNARQCVHLLGNFLAGLCCLIQRVAAGRSCAEYRSPQLNSALKLSSASIREVSMAITRKTTYI